MRTIHQLEPELGLVYIEVSLSQFSCKKTNLSRYEYDFKMFQNKLVWLIPILF